MRTPLPVRRSRAASTSASVGAVSVAKLEHLLHDLPYGCQWVQFSPLDLVQEPTQLWIALHSPLEVRFCPSGSDRVHLSGEVPAAPLLEEPLVVEMPAVCLDLRPQIGHSLVGDRLREDDGRLP